MRILILTQNWFSDVSGGSQRVATEQALELRKRGHEVVVCAQRVRYSDPSIARVSGVQLYRYSSPIARFFFGSSIVDLVFLARLIKKLDRKKPFDSVIAHHAYPGYAFIKSKVVAPLLYVFHASTAREAAVEVPIYWKRGWRRLFAAFATDIFIRVTKCIESAALSRAKAIAVFSEFSLQLLAETYPKQSRKAEIIPMGIDTDTFLPAKNQEAVRKKLGLTPDRFYFLTVRRLTPRMGVGALIEAMQLVVKKFGQVHLLICGNGPLRKKLQAQIQELGLSGMVTLLGFVSERDLRLYYQGADCFVLPSASFEGFGMATAEALASGLPAIGTPIGATPEILAPIDRTLVMRGSKSTDIAQTMMTFARKKFTDQEALRKRSRAFIVEHYRLEKAGQSLVRMLKKIM